MQTNAILINKNNIQFIKKNINSLGISLDGVEEINDLTRMYQNGKGSFEDFSKGLKILRENEVKYGGLTVVTTKNINYLIQLIKWCTNNSFNTLALEPIFFNGKGKACRDLYVTAELYWEKMRNLLDWCIEFNKTKLPNQMIYIRDFETVAKKILLRQESEYMCANVPCGAGIKHLGLNYNGDVYICDSFCGNENYCIGNIQNIPIQEILKNPLIEIFKKRSKDNIRQCKICSNKNVCMHGCVAKEIFKSGDDSINRRNSYCYYYFSLADYMKKLLLIENLDPNLVIKYYERYSKEEKNEV